jgi:hypothetical protein
MSTKAKSTIVLQVNISLSAMYFEVGRGGSPVRQFQNVVLQCAGTVQEHFRHIENKTTCRFVKTLIPEAVFFGPLDEDVHNFRSFDRSLDLGRPSIFSPVLRYASQH